MWKPGLTDRQEENPSLTSVWQVFSIYDSLTYLILGQATKLFILRNFFSLVKQLFLFLHRLEKEELFFLIGSL